MDTDDDNDRAAVSESKPQATLADGHLAVRRRGVRASEPLRQTRQPSWEVTTHDARRPSMAQAASYCNPCLVSRQTSHRTTKAGDDHEACCCRQAEWHGSAGTDRLCEPAPQPVRRRIDHFEHSSTGHLRWRGDRVYAGHTPWVAATLVDHQIDHQHGSHVSVAVRQTSRIRCVVPSTRIA